jgi:hypothetical protein
MNIMNSKLDFRFRGNNRESKRYEIIDQSSAPVIEKQMHKKY